MRCRLQPAIASFGAPHIAPHPPTARQLTGLPLLASQFGQFFVSTPQDLIQDGLYKALALALYPAPFNKVSCCLVARALGAIDVRAKGKAYLQAVEALSAVRKNTKFLPVSGPKSANDAPVTSSTTSGAEDSLQNVKVEPVAGHGDAASV